MCAGVIQCYGHGAKMMTVSKLLQHILGDTPVIALGIPGSQTSDGRKKLVPAIVCPGEHETFINEHLAGSIAPSLTSVKGNKQWMEHRARSISAYTVIRDENNITQCRWIAWDVDAAGVGHATEQGSEQAHLVAQSLYQVLIDAGISGFIVASGSGNGRHVWLVFYQPQPAAFAHWLALRVAEAVRQEIKSAEIEPFPKNPNPEGIGTALCLPFQGRPPGPAGGRLLVPATVEAISLVSDELLAPWRDRWMASLKAIEVVRRAEIEAHLIEREAWIRSHPGKRRVESADVDLEVVARQLGTITQDRGSHLHLHCPHHDGDRALQVVLSKRLWKCHFCAKSGAGNAAAFTLARWLMPGASVPEVYAVLSQIAGVVHV